MQNYKKQLFKCLCHLLLLFVIIYALILFLCCKINIREYFVSSSREYIIMFLEICIGIYATVITLLASQKTKFTVKLTEKDLNYKFVSVISLGLIINLKTSLVLSVFASKYMWLFSLELTLFILSVLYFAYFLIVLILMFVYNIDSSVDEDKRETKNTSKIMTDLEEIRRKVQKL